MAALGFLIVAAGLAGLYFIAKAAGVDVSSELQNVSDEIKSAVAGVTGGGDDPISLATPIIQGFESFSERAYPDPPGSGKYSIGWGHQIQPGEPYGPDSVIAQEEADNLLRIDIARFYKCVTDNVTADLTANQKAALISFCYNVGCGAFADSTLLRLLNQGDYESAAAQFPQWIHSGGRVSSALQSRRAQEQELFNA